MATAQEILQFQFSLPALRQSAQKVISVALDTLNEHRIDRLQKVVDEVGARSFVKPSNNLIPQVFKKFKTTIKSPEVSFDRRELRTLTYSFSYSEPDMQAILTNENELSYALTLLESSWRDSFLIGLVECLLGSWETKNQNELEQLERFVLNKLNNYSGNRATLISFRNNKQYFCIKNGAHVFGDALARRNISIQDATRELKVPDSWLTYSYFSQVILAYYHRAKNKIINEISNLYTVLQSHKSSVTNKRLVSKIIIQVNRPEYSELQETVKNMAFHLIGDPENTSKWMSFDGATETEKNELIEARNILNEWIAKQFIDVFFNVCINDERRKNFWLNVASKTKLTFKVFGPVHTKYLLKKDQRIADYVEGRFATVRSNRDVSAFILYIGKHMLIEFSNQGYAFYAYKIDSPNKPDLNYQLTSVDDLRNGSMPMAIQSDARFDYFNDEGRLTHSDGNQIWETRFNNWMNQIVFK